MKISGETLNVLKNFSSINSNIIISPGNVLKTLAPGKNILAEHKVAETFPREIGIWDLNKFLATVSLFKDPEFSFEEKYVEVKSSTRGTCIKYFYADPSLLTPLPKSFAMPKVDVEFNLTTQNLQELQKASSVLQVPDLALESQSDGIYLRVFDKKEDTSNVYQVKVGDNPKNLDFSVFFKTENLKLIPGSYKIGVSRQKISAFENTATGTKYWISLEADSKWSSGNEE